MSDVQPPISSNGNSVNKTADGVVQAAAKRRSPLPLIIVAALFVIVPFLTWYGTWFGRPLDDEKMTEYLSDESKPRHVQHALSQIAERLDKKDTGVRRWYPLIVRVANSSVTELRSNVAWVMGKDNTSSEFHTALLRLVQDSEPIVQRNAATALVTFGDKTGLPVLRTMLRPYSLSAQVPGTLLSVLRPGSVMKVGGMLAKIKVSDSLVQEVRSPLPGKIESVAVAEGAQITSGQVLLTISPDKDSVWEALKALYFVGEPQDLADVDRYARGEVPMPDEVKMQATQTAKAIQGRSGTPQ